MDDSNNFDEVFNTIQTDWEDANYILWDQELLNDSDVTSYYPFDSIEEEDYGTFVFDLSKYYADDLDEGCGKKKLKEDMNSSSPKMKKFGHFNVAVVFPNEKSVGRPRYTNTYGTEVEFYDDNNHEGFGPYGQFVSSYLLDTLFGKSEYSDNDGTYPYGLQLHGNSPNWTVPAETMSEIIDWLKQFDNETLKESVEPVYISVDVTRHNGSVIVKSDEFGKITYLPNDFEKLEDTIKRAVNDYAAENNISEYEVIKLYESKKALKEDYEEDEELTPVDADSLDVDEFYNCYVMDNAALWDEDIDYDAMEANKNQIFQFWKQLVKGGEDEWDAVEISVRRFASNEELDEGCGKKKKKALKESDDLWSQIQNYKKKYGNPYEESRPTSNGVNDEIKKILNKYNQEYNFLYNNHDKVAGYEEAVRAWDEYINHPDFRELIGKVIKARHDMFTSDREIGALMFALDALGYLDKFDGKESSLEPVVKEFKMNEGKSAKFYKIKCPQFNHLTKINKLAGEGDELASYYMKHRNDEFYSSKEAKEELKRYKNTSFKTYLTVEEA